MNKDVLRSFLDDCKANPLDDVPRLILADWLEEHGETDADRARGTFLRAQCQDDVTVAEALQLRHGGAWLAGFGAVDPGKVEYERGLLLVRAPSHRLLDTDPVEMPAWQWVETLEIAEEATRWESPLLDEVSALRIPVGWNYGHVRLARMLGSKHLGRLRGMAFHYGLLNDNHLTQFARWDGLGRLHHLQFLNLRLEEDGLEALAVSPHLGAIQRLELTIDTTERGLLTLLRSERLTSLRDLRLPRSDPDLVVLRALAGTAPVARVEALDLSTLSLLDDGATTLARLTLPSLRQLSLARCGIGVTGAQALADASWLPGLEAFDLSGNYLRAGVGDVLAGPLASVTRLDVSNTGAGITAIEALVTSTHPGRLARLDLSCNQLGPASMTLLTRASNLPGLRRLLLNACDVRDPGARALADWKGLANLEMLELRDCGLTESGLRALLLSAHLGPRTRLDLRQNQPSETIHKLAAEPGRTVLL
jgi:uncharacterized protein (TIGR02996 family)